MSNYKPTIGLEVHVELKTRTKMFCDCINDPDEKKPNTNVCPICLGHPGTLPFPNKKAIESIIKIGLALNGKPNDKFHFDRKNYFYPDLPKAYQISQAGEPIILGGTLRNIKINHIHLEEDAGKLIHDDVSGGTLVDFNRASVPLMELVTEPDIHTPEDAIAFMKDLQLIVRYLGVSDADLERGQMRADANISISETDELGTRAEIKNLNSFRSVFGAINYEIKRQAELLEKGEKIKQETRGWDDLRQKTISQRSKEESQDYRYFPEPDIPHFSIDAFDVERIKTEIPELPEAKLKRFEKEYNLSTDQARFLVEEIELAEYFEEAVSELKTIDEKVSTSTLYNYLTSDLRGLMNQSGINLSDAVNDISSLKVTPQNLAYLAYQVDSNNITSRQAKDILKKMFETGSSAKEIIENEKIGISDSSEIEAVVMAVIAENYVAVADYKKGKTASLQFLIGKAMGILKGRARPDELKEIFERNLNQF
jgi:aspartyl-tRNA(Asn)/glutamyl-tRNA(Gln) amidotransferase subunit B